MAEIDHREGANGRLGWLIPLAAALRPLQWVKNLLVFLPLFFSVNEAWSLSDVEGALRLSLRGAAMAAAFCMISGAVYLLNDWLDADQDRAHPRKRTRPIASGALPVGVALGACATLAAGGLALAFFIGVAAGVVALAYVVIQGAYSLALKKAALLDVFCVASGFVLRVVAGAAALDVPISPWLYICSGLGALFVALAKRRSELAEAGDSASRQRDTLGAYTAPMLDQLIGVVATSALVSYALYTFTASNLPDNHAMMLTLPFMVYGVFRYLYLVHTRNAGESPELILVTDPPLLAAVLLWLASSTAILLLAA